MLGEVYSQNWREMIGINRESKAMKEEWRKWISEKQGIIKAHTLEKVGLMEQIRVLRRELETNASRDLMLRERIIHEEMRNRLEKRVAQAEMLAAKAEVFALTCLCFVCFSYFLFDS
jgi:hypothetical protein